MYYHKRVVTKKDKKMSEKKEGFHIKVTKRENSTVFSFSDKNKRIIKEIYVYKNGHKITSSKKRVI